MSTSLLDSGLDREHELEEKAKDRLFLRDRVAGTLATTFATLPDVIRTPQNANDVVALALFSQRAEIAARVRNLYQERLSLPIAGSLMERGKLTEVLRRNDVMALVNEVLNSMQLLPGDYRTSNKIVVEALLKRGEALPTTVRSDEVEFFLDQLIRSMYAEKDLFHRVEGKDAPYLDPEQEEGSEALVRAIIPATAPGVETWMDIAVLQDAIRNYERVEILSASVMAFMDFSLAHFIDGEKGKLTLELEKFIADPGLASLKNKAQLTVSTILLSALAIALSNAVHDQPILKHVVFIVFLVFAVFFLAWRAKRFGQPRSKQETSQKYQSFQLPQEIARYLELLKKLKSLYHEFETISEHKDPQRFRIQREKLLILIEEAKRQAALLPAFMDGRPTGRPAIIDAEFEEEPGERLEEAALNAALAELQGPANAHIEGVDLPTGTNLEAANVSVAATHDGVDDEEEDADEFGETEPEKRRAKI